MAIKSPKCRFKARRDVIVVLNLEEKCLTSRGYVTTRLNAQQIHYRSICVINERVKGISLVVTNKHELVRMSI